MISKGNILESVLKNQKAINAQIKAAERELASIDAKRAALQDRIKQLQILKQSIADEQLPFHRLAVINLTNESDEKQKIAIFRSLFRGREDVFPRRFESKRTGKSGYQPVSSNRIQNYKIKQIDKSRILATNSIKIFNEKKMCEKRF